MVAEGPILTRDDRARAYAALSPDQRGVLAGCSKLPLVLAMAAVPAIAGWTCAVGSIGFGLAGVASTGSAASGAGAGVWPKAVFWVLIGVLLVPPVVLGSVMSRLSRRWAVMSQLGRTVCIGCDYPLAGLAVADGLVRCPECGEHTPGSYGAIIELRNVGAAGASAEPARGRDAAGPHA